MKLINKFVTSRNKRMFLLLVIIILLCSLFSIWPVKLIEGIVDFAQGDAGNVRQIVRLGILYFIFQIAGMFFRALFSYISAYLQNSIGVTIQNELYAKLLKVRLSVLDGKNSLEITNTLIEDTDYVSNNLVSPFTKLIWSFTSFVMGLMFMISISPALTLIILPCGLITSVSARAIQKKSEKNISEKREKSTRLWKTFAEGIRGIMPIRLYRYDAQYRQNAAKASEEMKKVSLVQSRLENINLFLVSSLFMVTIGVILVFSSIFVINGYITIGGLTAVLMYNHMLVDPLVDILDIQQSIIKLKVSLKRIESLFSMPDDANAMKHTVSVDKVVLKDVSFSYDDGAYTLSNINITLPSPVSVCIMGKSGSGKTTLANIIAGLYPPSGGEVVYYNNGVAVDGVPNVGYLIQDGYLFDASVADNIRVANPSVSRGEIEKLAQICRLEDVFEAHGDNPIGENGQNLSGGERKRVRIAQTLANSNADIYIFDELTSSLDEATAARIFRNILELNLNKLCIFIEHNPATQAFMDYVIKVEQGAVTVPDELL